MFIKRCTNSRILGLLVPRIQSSKPAGVGQGSRIDIGADPGLFYMRKDVVELGIAM